ncbi:MAG: DNA polymerase, partial [Fervidobacterium sp.]
MIRKKSTYPKRLIFFDTETTQKQVHTITYQIFKLACFQVYDREKIYAKKEEYYTFQKEEAQKYILSKILRKNTTYIISHNIVFDGTVVDLFKVLIQNHFRPTFFHQKGTTTILKFEGKRNEKLYILDSLNYIKLPLAIIGEAIGLPKLHINFKTCSNSELFLYCTRDTEIVAKAVSQLFNFIIQNRLGSIRTTIPAQAYEAYTKRFAKIPIQYQKDPTVQVLERESYHGGRTECFFIGKKQEPVYLLDINSLYPYILKTQKLPYQYIFTSQNPSIEDLTSLAAKEYFAIAKVLINTNEPVYPYVL